VLALAMLVLVLGVGGVMVSRVQARAAFESTSAGIAREYAGSAAQLGRLWIADDPNWRTNRSNTWLTDSPFDAGTISLGVVNPLGALNRSTLDPVVMTATGVSGVARQKLRLTLTPSPQPLSCLNAVLCAGGDVLEDNGVLTAPGLLVSSNGNVLVKSGSAIINANVEASGSATGGSYGGTKKSGQTPKVMPTIATVINEYTLIGSAMTYASVPKFSGVSTFKNLLISPASPVFGAAAQANGVYILDCKGTSVSFVGIRVVGTIVLVNCGGLQLDGEVSMRPAVANYPCLIVQGSLTFQADAAALKESSVGVNLNPASTPWPYPAGVSNATMTDQYPCGITGLTYVSGSFTLDNKKDWTLGPTIVGGSVSLLDNSINFIPCPEYAASPPPGFATINMVVSGAAWEQAVD